MLPRRETSVPLLEYSYMFSRIFITSGILIMTIKSVARNPPIMCKRAILLALG